MSLFIFFSAWLTVFVSQRHYSSLLLVTLEAALSLSPHALCHSVGAATCRLPPCSQHWAGSRGCTWPPEALCASPRGTEVRHEWLLFGCACQQLASSISLQWLHICQHGL